MSQKLRLLFSKELRERYVIDTPTLVYTPHRRYFPDIFNISGQWDLVKKYGDWYTYDKTARALIFQRDHGKAVSVEGLRRLLRLVSPKLNSVRKYERIRDTAVTFHFSFHTSAVRSSAYRNFTNRTYFFNSNSQVQRLQKRSTFKMQLYPSVLGRKHSCCKRWSQPRQRNIPLPRSWTPAAWGYWRQGKSYSNVSHEMYEESSFFAQ